MSLIRYPFLREYTTAIESSRAAIPLGSDPTITSPEFVGIGFDGDPDDPAANLETGWTLTAPAGSQFGNLAINFTGSLSYGPADSKVTLAVIDPVLTNALRHLKPPWVKLPDRIVYGGIDRSDLERTLRAQDVRNWKDFRSWNGMVDDFLAGTGQIPVRSGFPLITNASGARAYIITGFDDTTAPGTPLSLNLSWYVQQWPELFSGLTGHSLETQLTETKWPVWTSPHTVRYVKFIGGVTAAAHGGSPADFFKDRTRPARSLAEAIQYAQPYDTVLILDTHTYAEGELIIDKPLSVTSSATVDPTSAGFTPSQFPRIRPVGASGRVFRIDGSAGAIGPVSLAFLTIENGRTTSSTPPTFVGGAGVAVIDEDVVLIYKCCIRNNRTTVDSFGTVNLQPLKADILSLLNALPGPLPGVLVPLWNAVQGSIPTTVPNFQLAGQSFGGGVCFGWSNGWLLNCLVSENRASGRGNGVAMVGYGWPGIGKCHISNNEPEPGTRGRRDGGGIAMEVAIPEQLGRSLTQQDLADDLHHWLSNLGIGDIASIAIRLGGVLVGDGIVPQIAQAYIGARKWDLWNEDDIKTARRSAAIISNCQVNDNLAFDDGGGLYTSVLSRTSLIDSVFNNNEAEHGGGGGVRVSMGSDVNIQRCSIQSNTANSQNLVSGSRLPGPPGGGGLASRNTAVQITGTAAHPTTISNNTCTNWAGGGIVLEATSEGSMLFDGNEIWQSILTEVFDFDEMEVRIGTNVSIQGNQAQHSTTYHYPDDPAGSTRGPHGWAGGVYIIRGAIDEVADMDIEIEQFDTTVSGNTARAGALRRDDGTVRSATTHRFRLVDLEDHINDGDDQIADHLDGTTFEYEGD